MPVFTCTDCGCTVDQIPRQDLPGSVCFLCNSLRVDSNLSDAQKAQIRQIFRDNIKPPNMRRPRLSSTA